MPQVNGPQLLVVSLLCGFQNSRNFVGNKFCELLTNMSGVCIIRVFNIFSSHALLAFACIRIVHMYVTMEYTRCSIHLVGLGTGN